MLLCTCIKFWNRSVVSFANTELRLRIGVFWTLHEKESEEVLSLLLWLDNGTVCMTWVFALGKFFFPLYDCSAPDEKRILLVLTVVSSPRDISDFSETVIVVYMFRASVTECFDKLPFFSPNLWVRCLDAKREARVFWIWMPCTVP